MRRSHAPSRRSTAFVNPRTKRVKHSTSATNIIRSSTLPLSTKRRTETKRVVTMLTNQAGTIPQSGNILPLPEVVAGNDSNEREGRAIQIKAWQVRGRVFYPNTGYGGLYRIIVFLWKLPLTVPNVGDIVEDGFVSGGPQPFNGVYRIDTAAAYTILQDRIFDCNTYAAFSSSNAVPHIASVNMFGKIDVTQTYSTQFGGSVQDNKLYVCLLPNGAQNGSAILSSSMTYIDI